jgi:hypothetical protein
MAGGIARKRPSLTKTLLFALGIMVDTSTAPTAAMRSLCYPDYAGNRRL